MCKEIQGILVRAWPKGRPNPGGAGGAGCVSVFCSRATFHPVERCVVAKYKNINYRFRLERFYSIEVLDSAHQRIMGSWREGCGYICHNNPAYTELLNNASQYLHAL